MHSGAELAEVDASVLATALQWVAQLCQGVDRAVLAGEESCARAVCAVRAQGTSNHVLNFAAIAARYAVLHHGLDRVAVLSDQADACEQSLGSDDNFRVVRDAHNGGLAALEEWRPELVVGSETQGGALEDALLDRSQCPYPLALLLGRRQAARLLREGDGEGLTRVVEVDEDEDEELGEHQLVRGTSPGGRKRERMEQEAEKEEEEEKRARGAHEQDQDQDDDEDLEVDILADGESDSQEGSAREGPDLALDFDGSEKSFTEEVRARPTQREAFVAPAAVVVGGTETHVEDEEEEHELDMDEINALIGEELGDHSVVP